MMRALLAAVIYLLWMHCSAIDSDKLHAERLHCKGSSLPVLPSSQAISHALAKLNTIEWVNAKQHTRYSYHQIPQVFWLNGRETPKKVPDHHLRMVANNTNFHYAYIDDVGADTFLNEVFYNTSYLWAYHNLHRKLGAGRADFFRYAVLYVFGGVYMDTDGFIGHDIEKYIEPQDGFIIAGEQPIFFNAHQCYHSNFYLRNDNFTNDRYRNTQLWQHRFVVQSMLISRPRHPLLSRLMANIVEIFRQLKCENSKEVFTENINPEYKLLCSTGPGMLTVSMLQASYLADKVVWDSYGVKYAGLQYKDIGAIAKYPNQHEDTSPNHWKKLLRNGTSLMEDHAV